MQALKRMAQPDDIAPVVSADPLTHQNPGPPIIRSSSPDWRL
jgi:hypothetical protein